MRRPKFNKFPVCRDLQLFFFFFLFFFLQLDMCEGYLINNDYIPLHIRPKNIYKCQQSEMTRLDHDCPPNIIHKEQTNIFSFLLFFYSLYNCNDSIVNTECTFVKYMYHFLTHCDYNEETLQKSKSWSDWVVCLSELMSLVSCFLSIHICLTGCAVRLSILTG